MLSQAVSRPGLLCLLVQFETLSHPAVGGFAFGEHRLPHVSQQHRHEWVVLSPALQHAGTAAGIGTEDAIRSCACSAGGPWSGRKVESWNRNCKTARLS